MKIREQLKEMFQMQRTLNENILNEFGEEAMTEGKLELAIIDEAGEDNIKKYIFGVDAE